ncbi:VOC family protein [Nocardia sp. CDC159]|uniref:VOC family protein n=1 Tax=Nocardia pulmonis TaxID=2951408 RepID=A0A9X2EBB5_9NOCA|nr:MULTISPECIES: VOC family protein [Nocardia]MCM6777779.1 VOC family protein [Nocardia pulmonis]MCM6790664.1 VOC family protein [Nocardia sp. CDC159]
MRQLKISLRVTDLERSTALYRRVGFDLLPGDEQPNLRYLAFGDTWLILADRFAHGYHNDRRAVTATGGGPLGSGVVLAVPVEDLDRTYRLWRAEGLTVTLEPEDSPWARIFYGLDPDGYELMFEQFHPTESGAGS